MSAQILERFRDRLQTLSPDRLAAIVTRLDEAHDDRDALALITELDQLAAQADVDALDLTMSLRRRS